MATKGTDRKTQKEAALDARLRQIELDRERRRRTTANGMGKPPAREDNPSDSKRPPAGGRKKNRIFGFRKFFPKKAATLSTKLSKILIRVGVVFLAVITIIALAQNSADWSIAGIGRRMSDSSAMRGRGKGFPSSVTGSLSKRHDLLAGGVCVLTDTTFTAYNKTAKISYTTAHYMVNPLMETNGHYSLVYDDGGTKYRLETAAGTLCEGKTDNPIISGSVSEDGHFVLSTHMPSHLSAIFAFDRAGVKQFECTSSDYYITSVAVSSQGDSIAACGINTEGGVYKSVVIFFDTSSQKESGRFEFSGTLLFDVQFMKSGFSVAVGADKAVVFSENLLEKTEFPLSGETNVYGINGAAGAIFFAADEGEANSGTLLALDTKGRTRFELPADMSPVDVSIGKKYVAVLLLGEVRFYNLDGEAVSTVSVSPDTKSVLVSGSTAYILGSTKIDKIDIK
ncbi:MAG: DUF5711 family protein [Oscillospiraceae bacterium]|jgi:hypothetical protein|nr:DUF5711 family protein [Oscillospiraceae bacterium]